MATTITPSNPFIGHWQLDYSDNFNCYMKALGFDYGHLELIDTMEPLTITYIFEADGKIVEEIHTAVDTYGACFAWDTEFEQVMPLGDVVSKVQEFSAICWLLADIMSNSINPFIGAWSRTESRNFSGYMRAMGYSGVSEQQISTVHPVVIMYSMEGDGKIRESTLASTISYGASFHLDVEFEQSVRLGPLGDMEKTSKNVVTIEGSKLTHKVIMGSIEGQIVREVQGNEMVSTYSAGGHVAVIKFKKVVL